MIAMIEFTRRWYETEAMKPLSPVKNSSSADMTSYEDLETYLREHAGARSGINLIWLL